MPYNPGIISKAQRGVIGEKWFSEIHWKSSEERYEMELLSINTDKNIGSIINNYCANCILILTVLKGQIISAPGINGNNMLSARPQRAV